MAQVPYRPVPDVAPSAGGTPTINLSTPVAAFGGAVAQGLGELGHGVEKFGDAIWRQAVHFQEMENETEAMKLTVEAEDKIGVERAKMQTLEGAEAAKAQPGFNKRVQEIHEQTRTKATNDDVRRRFDSRTAGVVGRNINSAALHAGTELKKARDEANLAVIESLNVRAGQDPLDEAGFERTQRDTERAVRQYARGRGMLPDKEEQLVTKAFERNRATRAVEMSKEDSVAAKKYIEENKGQFGDHEERVVKDVDARHDVIAGTNAGNAVFGDDDLGDPRDKLPKSRDEYISAAQSKARLDGGTPNAERIAGLQAGQRYDRWHRKQLEFKNDTNLQIGHVLQGAGTGKMPTSVDEFRRLPGGDALWVGADRATQNKIGTELRRNIRQEWQPTDESERRYSQLLGMRTGSSEEKNELLTVDAWAEPHMTPSMKRSIEAAQQRLRANRDQDPQLNWAIGQLRDWFKTVPFDPNQGTEESQVFRGAFQTALQDWQEANLGKKPPVEELKLMASRILITEHGQKSQGFFRSMIGNVYAPWETEREKLYKLAVPEDRKAVYEQDERFKKFGYDPGSTLGKIKMRELWIRDLYKESYKTVPKGGRGKRSKEEQEAIEAEP